VLCKLCSCNSTPSIEQSFTYRYADQEQTKVTSFIVTTGRFSKCVYCELKYAQLIFLYHISWPIRRTFFPEKCDLNSTCVLCAEGKYYFQTYKYPYIYYTTSLSWDSENNHEEDFSGSDDDFLGFYDE